MTVLDRFLKYVTFDTQSNEETGTTPSTPGQRVFAEALVKELEAIGMDDISKQAINVAKENAKLNDVPAIFERSNLFEDVADETFDVIVSNPPYIRSDEIPFLMPEVSEFEPHEALDGKEDGLFFYRKIIQESPDYLTDGGYLLFEIGYDQGWAVSSMMKEAGFEDVCVKKDLARNDRVVCGHKHLCEKRG